MRICGARSRTNELEAAALSCEDLNDLWCLSAGGLVTKPKLAVAVVGGGIGGMSLALSLHAAGIQDVDVYESASDIRELGVGINVLPHAVRELDELGLLDELLKVGVATADFTYFTRLGQPIWEEPLGVAAGYRWPQLSVHRGELLAVLHRAVAGRLGPDRIHTGHHLARFDGHSAGGISAEFMATRRMRLSRVLTQTCWWDATGFTPPCAGLSTRPRGRCDGTA